MGDFASVYLEGEDPVAGNRGFAASQSSYDRWFKDELRKIFRPRSTPTSPPIEQFFDSETLPS